MIVPRRLKRQADRHALVDGVPFELPIDSADTPALMAAFPIDRGRAAELLPGNELHPLRLPGGRGVLIVTVVDYKTTDIGSYIEFSIAIGCTHGGRRSPALLAALRGRAGQYVVDLPVSTEISVKGGKGIWGMPKHRAYLEFDAGERVASSRYYLDGEPAVTIEVDRPRFDGLPIRASAANYCAFRGMLMRSAVHFRARGGVNWPFSRSARLTIGDHPRVAPLKRLEIGDRPLFAAWFRETGGILDDHLESWFLSYERPPQTQPEGLESVIDLGLSREWPPSPDDVEGGGVAGTGADSGPGKTSRPVASVRGGSARR